MTDAEPRARLAEVEREILARTPEHDITPTLDRIDRLVDLLGSPQRAMPVVQLTGTNGKTSTTRMVEALLRGFGLRTGRFTSPHLHSIRERIAFDGEPIDAQRFVDTYDDVVPYVRLVDANSAVPMSFFEVLAGMAYAAFAEAPVDVAVVEVGLGGSWDATNVADAQVAVVMPVALDHERFLGSTVAEIATEKAGIIKPGSVAVLAQQPFEAAEVLLRRTIDVGASVVREGMEFGVRHRAVAVGGQVVALQGIGGVYEDVFLGLHGAHQAHNAAAALAAVETFLGGGRDRLDLDVVRSSLAGVTSPARLEVVRGGPTVLVDAAHNPAGAAATAQALRDAFDFSYLVGVIAIFADKDARGILEALEPVLAEVVVTEADSPRAMAADELAALAVEVFGDDRVLVTPRLGDAIDDGIRLAEEQGGLGGAGVVVTGSITTAAQARAMLGRTTS